MNIKNEKGIALIMSIGIVAMLAIIGTTFAINMRLEQKASANYLAGIKAKTLAEAGIDHAIAVLRLYAITQAYSDIDDEWRWYGTAIKLYGTSDYSGEYEVSAIDCASQIYINDGLYLTGASKTERDIKLKTMLNNLCVAIGGSLTSSDGDTIVDRRPSGADGGYITKEIVRQVLNTAKYNDIKNYITVNTWVDPDTIRPLGSAATPEVQARAPVNVNTASWPVLVAVLQGVSTGEVITSGEAGNVADSIISQSNVRPFTNWNGALLTGGFNTYINDQVPALITQTKADIIKANANPNTKLNRLNPNSSWKAQAPADKTELTTLNTTEFCFNSMGYYELESTGTVTIGSSTVAQQKVRALVKLYDLWRQTTQAQFEAGNKGTPDYVSTYPEFDPDESTVSASSLDGQIMIKKNAMDSPAGVIFRASFTGNGTQDADDFDAQTGVGGTNSTVSGLTEASIFSAGDLYSDGVYISGSGNLSYLTSGNFLAGSTDEGTIEMWVKPSYDVTGASGVHYFFSFQDAGATEYVRLFDDNGILKFQVDDATNALLEATTDITTWNANAWYHIAATWDWDWDAVSPDTGIGLTVIRLFVDGAAPVTATAVGPAPMIYDVTPLPTNMYVGSDAAASPANQAYATIGEVRIWNSEKWTAAFTPDDLYQDSTDGTFTSALKSTGTVRKLGTLSWTESIPSGISGDIRFQIDSGDGSFTLPSLVTYYGDNGGSGTDIEKAGGSSIINIDTASPYDIRYRATLSASVAPLKDTPVLDDVTITYFTPVRFFSYQEVAE